MSTYYNGFSEETEKQAMLVKVFPNKFDIDLAETYKMLFSIFSSMGDAEKGFACCRKAIPIYEKLLKVDAERFTPTLALLYITFSDYTKDYSFLKKAKALAMQYPNDETSKMVMHLAELSSLD